MTILRIYILKNWFKTLMGSIFFLLLLLTAGNLVAGFLRSNVTALDVIKNYIIELPNLLGRVIPISCIFASIFAIEKQRSKNELVAIFASGLSFKKYLSILLSASVLVSLILFIFLGFVYPYSKSERHNILKDKVDHFSNQKSVGLRTNTLNSGKMWYKGKNYFFSLVNFDLEKNTIYDFKIYFFKSFKIIEKVISAKKAIHLQNKEWELHDATIIDNSKELNFPKTTQEKKYSIFIEETPEDLSEIESDITTLNIIDLFEYIRKLKKSTINTDEYQIIFLEKIGTSLICVFFTILGALSLYSPNRRGSHLGKLIFYTFVLVILYWLGNSYFLELGKNSKINPFYAVFIPHLILTAFIGFIMFKKRKLS
ncbi:MAG: LptF/LptG family permease [Halobacteriovoraceae bacterium]|nr:LptF/LptG family permease [Halobacteriovoraceae bacterium]